MKKNLKETGEKVAEQASKVLREGGADAEERQLAGSVLAQRGDWKETGEKVATTASKVLRDETSSKEEKRLAGSALAQAKGKK